MEDRELARLLAATRVGFGALFLLAPGFLARAWVGEGAVEPAAKALARGLGIRDAALGLGVLVAIKRDESAGGWLEAGALADVGDAVATLVGWRHLPSPQRWLALAASAGAFVVGVRLARGEGSD